MSTNWVATSAGGSLSKSTYTIDTDVGIFPDSLMVSGLKWRWLEAKIDPRAPLAKQEYMRQLDIAISADGGSKTLSMAPSMSQLLLSQTNLPDSNFGTP